MTRYAPGDKGVGAFSLRLQVTASTMVVATGAFCAVNLLHVRLRYYPMRPKPCQEVLHMQVSSVRKPCAMLLLLLL